MCTAVQQPAVPALGGAWVADITRNPAVKNGEPRCVWSAALVTFRRGADFLKLCVTSGVAATRTNSEILRVDEDTGTLEVGKFADLVAWRRDPLEEPKTFIDRDAVAPVMKAAVILKDIR